MRLGPDAVHIQYDLPTIASLSVRDWGQAGMAAHGAGSLSALLGLAGLLVLVVAG